MIDLTSNRLVKSSAYPVAPYSTLVYLLAYDNREPRIFEARIGGIFYFIDMGVRRLTVFIHKTEAVWAMKTIFTC